MTALSSRSPLSQSLPQLKLPAGWTLQPSTKTRSQLLEERRKAQVPDPSFDLDRDGIVGSQDLFLAKRFDWDKDGRLNSAERKAAEQALREGVTNQFVWGVEQSAPHRSYRLLQKRGVVVDTEDFTGVRSTYPQPEAGSGKTQTQLRQERAQARLAALKEERKLWEAQHPFMLQVETREFSNLPREYASYTQKIDLERKKVRLKAGLLGAPTELPARPAPPQGYASSPNFQTKAQMDRERKRKLLEDLHLQKNFGHKTADLRLEEREARQVTILPPNVKNRNFSDIREQRRQETNEYNVKTFSNVVVGIHGHELPKFEDTQGTDYWRTRPGYVEQPEHTSRLRLVAEQRFWAPKDRYALSDVEASPPPPDPFKSVHVKPKPVEAELPEKPTKHVPKPYVHWALDDPRRPAPVKHEYRWTTLVHLFTKGSVFSQLKDPDIDNFDEVKEDAKESTTLSSELAGTMQSSATKKSVLGLGKKLMKQGATLVRSSGFQASNG